jgi:hypothetical protein
VFISNAVCELVNFSLYQVVGVRRKNKFELNVVNIKTVEGIKKLIVSKRVLIKSILSVGVEIQLAKNKL